MLTVYLWVGIEVEDAPPVSVKIEPLNPPKSDSRIYASLRKARSDEFVTNKIKQIASAARICFKLLR